MNEQFTWHRLGILIRNDFIAGYRGYLNIGTVIFIIMALNVIPNAGFGNTSESIYYKFFTAMLFLWGTPHASRALQELTDKRLNESFLLLPASAVEKTISRYLYSSVFFVAHILVYTTLACFILEGINQLMFGLHNGQFNPFDPYVWQTIAVFMAVQPIFFLGGAWFKSARWFKTIMFVFVIAALLGAVLLVSFLLFFAGSFHDVYALSPGNFDDISAELHLFGGSMLALKILFYGVLPPFCVFVTWLRIRETQVSHGI